MLEEREADANLWTYYPATIEEASMLIDALLASSYRKDPDFSAVVVESDSALADAPVVTVSQARTAYERMLVGGGFSHCPKPADYPS